MSRKLSDVSSLTEHTDLRSLGRAERIRLPERIVEEIRRFIDESGLAPGTRLPAERQLMERLGVGRSSLREALRVLSTLGLVEIRRGDGMYVGRPPRLWATGTRAVFDAAEENALRDLVEARLGVELVATSLAAERGTEEDFARLEAFLDEQEAAVERSPDFAWRPLGFELAVVEIAANPLFVEFEQVLADHWKALSPSLLLSVGHYREWFAEHRAILASMRSRNVAQVRRLVTAHVHADRFEQDIRSRPREKTGVAQEGGET